MEGHIMYRHGQTRPLSELTATFAMPAMYVRFSGHQRAVVDT